MKKFLIFVFTSFVISIYSQIRFEKGFIVDNKGNKTECFIRNVDWISNPKYIEYKVTENADIIKKTVDEIEEFSTNNGKKYISFLVKIDRSSDDLNNMSTTKSPVFIEEKLFLKEIVTGEKNLYVYTDNNLTRFFHKNFGGNIEQLVYKPYVINNRVRYNEDYINQLKANLTCSTLTDKDFNSLSYDASSLKKIFNKYNKCVDPNFAAEKVTKKDNFNLYIKPRINSYSIKHNNFKFDAYDFEYNGINAGVGIEAEFIFNFNRNKWALIFDPNYISINRESENKFGTLDYEIIKTKLQYNTLELPVGVRYYSNINTNAKLFFNFQVVFDLYVGNSNFQQTYINSVSNFDINTSENYAFGIGFKYKRLLTELKYHTSKDLSSRAINHQTDFKNITFSLGYNIF